MTPQLIHLSGGVVSGNDLLWLAMGHSAVWAIDNAYAQAALAYLSEKDYGEHKAEFEARVAAPSPVLNRIRPEDRLYTVESGVAMIPIQGVMTMKPTSFGGCSTILTRRAVRMASFDQDVKETVLLVNSPGGTVEGTDELALAIAEAAAFKPVTAYLQGQCGSAAYWVASFATRIVSHRHALCGSIGCFNALTDSSEAAKQDGRRVILVSSRPKLKGQGTPGVPISDEAVAMVLSHVQYFGDDFDAIVLKNRKLTKAQSVEAFTGGTFVAPDALRLGLIDAVQPLDDLLAEMQESDVEEDDEEPEGESDELRVDAPPTALFGPTTPCQATPITKAQVREAIGAHKPTISAPTGGEPRPRAEDRPQPGAPGPRATSTMENWKNRLADACRARGLGMIASALDNTTREDPETAARVVSETVNAQVQDHLANDPLSRAVRAQGIESVEDLQAFAAHKAVGERLLNEARAATHRLSIVAYGPVKGPQFSAAANHLGYDAVIDLRNSFAAVASEEFDTTPMQPAPRRTAPNDPATRATDATQSGARPIDKIDEAARATIVAQAPNDEARQDRLATEYVQSLKEMGS